jgi:hypothetical protein
MAIKRTKRWGILTVIFWSLYVAYYLQYPLRLLLLFGWQFYAGLLILFTGIASGVLLLVHPRSGRIIAISLSTLIIISRLWYYASSFSQIGERLYALYVIYMSQHPIQVVFFDILSYVYWVSSILYLSKMKTVSNR